MGLLSKEREMNDTEQGSNENESKMADVETLRKWMIDSCGSATAAADWAKEIVETPREKLPDWICEEQIEASKLVLLDAKAEAEKEGDDYER